MRNYERLPVAVVCEVAPITHAIWACPGAGCGHVINEVRLDITTALANGTTLYMRCGHCSQPYNLKRAGTSIISAPSKREVRAVLDATVRGGKGTA